jgi:flagellar biosynthesis protein FlhG
MSFESAEEWLSQLHQDLKQNKRNGRVISVTGGKGGVGKSTLSIKLAQTLAKTGEKVLLVDSDVNLSNIAVKLGEPLTDDFFQLLMSQKDFNSCLIKKDGVDILPGCNGNVDIFKGELSLDKILIDIIDTHRYEYDFVIIDSPAGLSTLTLNLNAYSDDRFVIVNPDNSSMTDAYSLMKLLSQQYGSKDFHLIVNKVSNSKQYYKVIRGLGDTVDRFLGSRLNILGTIPFSDVGGDLFDKMLFSAEKSSIDKNFVHIIEKYTEKHSRQHISEEIMPMPVSMNYEHEVQPVC